MKKIKNNLGGLICNHETKFRQAVGFGRDAYTDVTYAVVCLKCGKLLFKHTAEADNEDD